MPAIVYSTEVDVASVAQTRALLTRFEPDLLKRLDRRLTRVASIVKAGAQSRFERTGASGAAYRIRTRNQKGRFIKSVTTAPGSASGGEKWSGEPGVLAAILELMAGVRDAQPQNVPRTKNLISTLTSRYGSPGRFLWDSWDEHEAVAMQDVESAIREAEEEYSARMEGAV